MEQDLVAHMAPEDVLAAAGVSSRERWRDAEWYNPSHNVAPGGWTPVLRLNREDHGREVQTMKWGLVPSWTKPEDKHDHWKMFNARCESLNEKPVFSRLLRGGKRCVVIMDGFYEWKKDGNKKQPYYIYLRDRVMFMAGLYDVCTGLEGQPLHTFTIVTTDSSKSLAWLHDRMPVLLPGEAAVEAWLQGPQEGTDYAKFVQQLCHPYGGPDLAWHPVTPAMSNIQYKKPDCSEDVRTKQGSISSFFSKPKPAAVNADETKGEGGAVGDVGRKEGAAAGAGAGAQGKDALHMGLKAESPPEVKPGVKQESQPEVKPEVMHHGIKAESQPGVNASPPHVWSASDTDGRHQGEPGASHRQLAGAGAGAAAEEEVPKPAERASGEVVAGHGGSQEQPGSSSGDDGGEGDGSGSRQAGIGVKRGRKQADVRQQLKGKGAAAASTRGKAASAPAKRRRKA